MAQQKIVQTAGRTQLGEFAPEFAHLNDDILFGEVWSRNDLLSLRDRSLVTITSLISQGITDNSLKYHLQSAKNNGITRTEAAEIITHIAFYAGWPKAWAAFNLAKEVWNEDVKGEDAKAAFQREMIFPIGEPNTAYAKYFKGNSYLAKISDSQIPFFNVTFEPGCRNNWHIHHATKGGGQMLVGIAGRGWYQEEGKPAQEILPGTVIHIPANVKHWHGAAKDSWFAHLAFEIPGENTSNEWQEAVSDEEYNKIKQPELLNRTQLGKNISRYEFFDYTSNEALHLSAAEVNIFRDVLSMISQELEHPIDRHSRELIVSNIELLLNYCLRFYDRQFITREEINHSVVKKFISLLDEYIARKAEREGLPTVAYFADKCCYSTKYFGELVKTETGRTAKSLINDGLLSAARQLLVDETLSITQVSQHLGFEYPQHFVRFFKAQTGKTPSEYRKTA